MIMNGRSYQWKNITNRGEMFKTKMRLRLFTSELELAGEKNERKNETIKNHFLNAHLKVTITNSCK